MNDRVTIHDARMAGYCALGAKTWFEAHGLDFRDFLTNGMSMDKARELAATDAIAEHILTVRQERELDPE